MVFPLEFEPGGGEAEEEGRVDHIDGSGGHEDGDSDFLARLAVRFLVGGLRVEGGWTQVRWCASSMAWII